jgi:HAE1 family hydrophobic/amphiphilic exporter-1
MSRFFINRPIVAIVISILFVVGGTVMVLRLPVAQFPEIAPPQIETTAVYTGADALTVEQAIAGNDGTMTLQVSFETDTDIDIDQVQVQNRLAQAQANLPTAVNDYGLTTIQTAGIPLLVFTINSPKGTWDQNFLSNYVVINVKDELARVPGIGQVKIFGAANYAMRIWVNPDTIANMGLTVSDLVNAVTAQNVVNPADTRRRAALLAGSSPTPSGRAAA